MATDTALRSVGYAQQEPAKPAPWHALVGLDVMFNGLTTGLFLTAALAELAAPDTFAPVAVAAYPVALVFLAADLILLVLDLGDSRRFHHMLRVFKPESPMSFGVWSLTAYSLPLAIAALLSLFPMGGELEWVRKAAIVLGLLPALASAVYKGVLLSTSAQPVWKEARWLGGYLTGGAVVLGCAEMVLLAYLTGQPRAAAALRPALGMVLILEAIPLILLGPALRSVDDRIFTPGQRGFVFALAAVGGLFLPLALMIVGSTMLWMVTASILIIVWNLFARFMVVQLPHRFQGERPL